MILSWCFSSSEGSSYGDPGRGRLPLGILVEGCLHKSHSLFLYKDLYRYCYFLEIFLLDRISSALLGSRISQALLPGVKDLLGFAGIEGVLSLARIKDLLSFVGIKDLLGFAGIMELLHFAKSMGGAKETCLAPYDIIIKLLQNYLAPQREAIALLCNLYFIKPL
nr:hypothetical protein CFP56_25402 [Quercus suber]